MKRLYTERYDLNEIGKELYRKYNDVISDMVLEDIKMGADPSDIENILYKIIQSVKKDGIIFLTNYFDNKKYNTEKLTIRLVDDPLVSKTAVFKGFDNKGHRFWEYEEGWTPIYPFGIKDTEGTLEWYLLLDFQDKESM